MSDRNGTDVDLLGQRPEKPKGKKKAVTEGGDGAHGRAMARYFGWFEERWKCRPLDPPSRIAKHISEMLKAWGEADTLKVIDTFFTTKDPRIAGSDYSIGVFRNNAQRLKIGNSSNHDRRLASNVDAARRVTE